MSELQLHCPAFEQVPAVARALVGHRVGAFSGHEGDRQEAAFQAGQALGRDTDYFEERIGEIRTAKDLVDDTRLLRIALGANGVV